MTRQQRTLRGDGQAALEWIEDLRFVARVGDQDVFMDSTGAEGTTPPVLLLEAVAGCMAIDVVDILKKGRQELTGVAIEIAGDRMPEPPRYFTDVHMVFRISGVVAEAKAERAVELSMGKYCSVFHTLRKDLVFTYEIELDSD